MDNYSFQMKPRGWLAAYVVLARVDQDTECETLGISRRLRRKQGFGVHGDLQG